jgi:hypothetical protein
LNCLVSLRSSFVGGKLIQSLVLSAAVSSFLFLFERARINGSRNSHFGGRHYCYFGGSEFNLKGTHGVRGIFMWILVRGNAQTGICFGLIVTVEKSSAVWSLDCQGELSCGSDSHSSFFAFHSWS